MNRILSFCALLLAFFACCPASPPTLTRVPMTPVDTPAPTEAEATTTPTLTATPAPTPTIILPSSGPTSALLPSGHVQAQTVRVIDGDTIEVLIEGQTYTVRYIGIDTPETKHPDKPVEPFGPEAAAKNEELIGGKVVELEKDVSETDQYGRLLRYVYVGDLMINAELVRLGYAQVSTYPPDVKYQDLFLQLQREAREANRGLWGAPSEPAPLPTDTPQIAPVPLPAAECPYIGNSNTGKFHRAGCSSIDRMKEEHKVCLQSREEAIASGYVPCKRCNP